MRKLPENIGPLEFGVKIGVVVPGVDLVKMITSPLTEAAHDGLLDAGDVVCVTESIVARAQNNFVTVADIAAEVQEKLNLSQDSKIGVLFPITSRNRFSLILQGIASAVPAGEVIVQLSYPADEVGNQVIAPELAEELTAAKDYIRYEDLQEEDCLHPITKVNYLTLYKEIIEGQGARATIFLSNDPQIMTRFAPDGVLVADVHNREATRKKLSKVYSNIITLQELCREGESWSEWGLLGSNMSAHDKLKLAPRVSSLFVRDLQAAIKESTGRQVEVLVYGDGAYKDPSTGIYELADPQPVFGMTDGLSGRYREGIKYKYLADVCYAEGKSVEEIEALLEAQKQEAHQQNEMLTEGTTPRRVEDVIASLADLVSGSADAGTPVV